MKYKKKLSPVYKTCTGVSEYGCVVYSCVLFVGNVYVHLRVSIMSIALHHKSLPLVWLHQTDQGHRPRVQLMAHLQLCVHVCMYVCMYVRVMDKLDYNI